MLGLHAYHCSVKISRRDEPFYALIAAAMRKADTDNLAKLQVAFPETWLEFQKRYDAPLGVIPGDDVADMEALQKTLKEFYEQ